MMPSKSSLLRFFATKASSPRKNYSVLASCRYALRTVPTYHRYTSALRHFSSSNDWFCDVRHPITRRVVEFESRLLDERLGPSAELYKRLIMDASLAGEGHKEGEEGGDRVGDFIYTSERPNGANNIVISRRKADSRALETIFDLNKLETAFPSPLSVQLCRPSVDHRFVGLLMQAGEGNARVLVVKDMDMNRMYRLAFPSIAMHVHGFEWGTRTGENASIFISFSQDGLRPCAVYQCSLRHLIEHTPLAGLRGRNNLAIVKSIAVPPSSLRLIAQELEDARLFLDVTRSKDSKYVIVHSHSKTCSKAIIYDEISGSVNVFSKRIAGLQYYVTSCGESFYIVSNMGSAGGSLKLLRWNPTGNSNHHASRQSSMCEPTDWAEIYPGTITNASEVLHVADIDVSSSGRAVLYGRKHGRSSVSVIDLKTAKETCLQSEISKKILSSAYQIFPNANEGSDRVSFVVSSPLIQELEGIIDLRKSPISIDWSSPSASTAVQLRGVAAKEVAVASFDGTTIPMHLVGTEDNLAGKKTVPVLMVGYGSYGVSVPMHHRPELAVLLQQGWTIAYACVRGGGELGPYWHEQGRKDKKWNTFIDFAACAAHLHSQGYASPNGLCAEFDSAGGLIGGVMYSHFPSLFSGIVLRNAFLDAWATMRDPSRVLTEHEYDEWGDPADQSVSNYIRSYSPCSNVITPSAIPTQYRDFSRGLALPANKTAKPRLLVTVSLQDINVAPWDALKYLFLVRGYGSNQNIDLFRVSERIYGSQKYAAFRSYLTAPDEQIKPGAPSPVPTDDILFRVATDADHSGPRVLEDAAAERGVELAFLSKCVNSN